MNEFPGVKNRGISLVCGVSLAWCMFSSLLKATTAHQCRCGLCVDLTVSLAFIFLCIRIISEVTFHEFTYCPLFKKSNEFHLTHQNRAECGLPGGIRKMIEQPAVLLSQQWEEGLSGRKEVN